MSLHDALGPLYGHLFTLGSDEVTVAELAGFVTGAWGVWLTVRRQISNFGIGIVNNIVFLLLVLDARLYADAGLQIVFAVLDAQGWLVGLVATRSRQEPPPSTTDRTGPPAGRHCRAGGEHGAADRRTQEGARRGPVI